MQRTFEPSNQFLSICLAALVIFTGCRVESPAPELEDLAKLLGSIPSDSRLLGGVTTSTKPSSTGEFSSQSTTWLLLSSSRLPTPTLKVKTATLENFQSAPVNDIVEQNDAFPAQVLYGVAAELRVLPTLMPPIASEELAKHRGRIVEWSTATHRVRVREVELDRQWLTLVESF